MQTCVDGACLLQIEILELDLIRYPVVFPVMRPDELIRFGMVGEVFGAGIEKELSVPSTVGDITQVNEAGRIVALFDIAVG